MIQFKPGDIVCLTHVTLAARAIVTHVKGQKLRRRYLNSPESYEPEPWRHFNDFTLVAPIKTPESTPMIHALKSDPTALGTVLTHNSQGLAVFELRATAQILLIPDAEIEEVRPFTFQTHRNEHYTALPDSIELHDVLIINNTLHSVTKLNTRADYYNALPPSTRKVPTLSVA